MNAVKHLTGIAVLVASIAGSSTAASPAITVTDVWSRPATGTAVIYATLRNAANASDRLVGATSPFATTVELHQSSSKSMPGGSMSMGSMTMPMNGTVMSMNAVAAIPVPAHGSTSLSPGGYHLMLNLRSDLHAGERVPLRLHFARAGYIDVVARVRPI